MSASVPERVGLLVGVPAATGAPPGLAASHVVVAATSKEGRLTGKLSFSVGARKDSSLVRSGTVVQTIVPPARLSPTVYVKRALVKVT